MLYGHRTPPNFWSDKENFFGVSELFMWVGLGKNVLYEKCRAHWDLSIGMLIIEGGKP
jgi:hypothetical protein